MINKKKSAKKEPLPRGRAPKEARFPAILVLDWPPSWKRGHLLEFQSTEQLPPGELLERLSHSLNSKARGTGISFHIDSTDKSLYFDPPPLEEPRVYWQVAWIRQDLPIRVDIDWKRAHNKEVLENCHNGLDRKTLNDRIFRGINELLAPFALGLIEHD